MSRLQKNGILPALVIGQGRMGGGGALVIGPGRMGVGGGASSRDKDGWCQWLFGKHTLRQGGHGLFQSGGRLLLIYFNVGFTEVVPTVGGIDR